MHLKEFAAANRIKALTPVLILVCIISFGVWLHQPEQRSSGVFFSTSAVRTTPEKTIVGSPFLTKNVFVDHATPDINGALGLAEYRTYLWRQGLFDRCDGCVMRSGIDGRIRFPHIFGWRWQFVGQRIREYSNSNPLPHLICRSLAEILDVNLSLGNVRGFKLKAHSGTPT